MASTGTGGQRGGGNSETARLPEPEFLAPAGRSAPELWIAATQGRRFELVKLDRILPGGRSQALVAFYDAMVASFLPTSNPLEPLANQFSLSVGKFEFLGGLTEGSLRTP